MTIDAEMRPYQEPPATIRPADQFTESHIEYTTRVLAALRHEQTQLLASLCRVESHIEQAERYLLSITPV